MAGGSNILYSSDSEEEMVVEEQQEEGVSEITGDSVDEMVNRVYRNDEMVHLDTFTLENVKKAIKERIWDKTKFTSMALIKGTDLYDTNGFVHQVLDSLNLTSYGKVKRAKFWNRYGRYVLEVLSNCKCSASDGIKKDVIKGMTMFVTF